MTRGPTSPRGSSTFDRAPKRASARPSKRRTGDVRVVTTGPFRLSRRRAGRVVARAPQSPCRRIASLHRLFPFSPRGPNDDHYATEDDHYATEEDEPNYS
jgi:hypothetical protein